MTDEKLISYLEETWTAATMTFGLRVALPDLIFSFGNDGGDFELLTLGEMEDLVLCGVSVSLEEEVNTGQVKSLS